jgi:tetratricopeptide (TPR) repeat protein
MDDTQRPPIASQVGDSRSLDARKVIPVFVFVLALTAALASFDVLLVRVALKQRSETGSRLFERGNEAKRVGKIADALELFRAAHNQRPSDPKYHLAFAQALRSIGRARESQIALEDMLNRYPAHGPANAEMARSLAQTDNWQDAAWYYHRALYGEWNPPADLVALRFELADLLAKHNAREQLLSEVVLLNANAGEAGSRHLARLQLTAGDWHRGEQLYRAMLRANPVDPELLGGLARALLGSGRYLAAERTFRRAINAGSTDPAVTAELDLVTEINQSDPAVRGLDVEERHKRAHELASTLIALFRSCSKDDSLLRDSEQVLEGHRRSRNLARDSDADLDIVEQVWSVRHELCGAGFQVPKKVEVLARQFAK